MDGILKRERQNGSTCLTLLNPLLSEPSIPLILHRISPVFLLEEH